MVDFYFSFVRITHDGSAVIYSIANITYDASTVSLLGYHSNVRHVDLSPVTFSIVIITNDWSSITSSIDIIT